LTRTAGAAGVSCADTVARGLGFLSEAQLPHGEFPSFRHGDDTLSGPGQADGAVFPTTIVLYSLSLLDDPAARALVRRGLGFLWEERGAGNLWRYWSSSNPRPIDPDLDDTCCTSFLLRHLGACGHLRNEEAILATRAPDGLFKTWVRDASARNDVDSVVNANVVLYLGEREETRPAVSALSGILQDGGEEGTSWYYLDPLALQYAASRALVHGAGGLARCGPAVVGRVLDRRRADGSLGNELQTALALCVLANFGQAGHPAVPAAAAWLSEAQQPDGRWARRAFYAGPEPPAPHAVWWGSESVTTALCLEALVKVSQGQASRAFTSA
jgi:hypothetical protein